MTVPSAVLRRPVVTARVLCAVAAEVGEVGVSVSDVLAGTSVVADDLDDPEGDVSSADEITIDASHVPADVRRFFMERDIAFDCHRTVVRVPRGMLDELLPQADPHTLAVCVAQCEQILERRQRRHGLSAQVRSELLAAPGEMPGLDAVAASLHMHPRTLRRRLVEEGTSFRLLTSDVRAALATELLSQVGLTVEQVARRLGYAETAAFNHAFSRWFGLAPNEYRRRQGAC